MLGSWCCKLLLVAAAGEWKEEEEEENGFRENLTTSNRCWRKKQRDISGEAHGHMFVYCRVINI